MSHSARWPAVRSSTASTMLTAVGSMASAPNCTASVALDRIRLADEESALVPDHLTQVLDEEQAGGPGAGDEHRLHAAAVAPVERVPLAGAAGGIHGVDDARQRLGERRLGVRQRRAARHGVGARDDEEVREPAGQSGDAVLPVVLALVRVADRAVLAPLGEAGAAAALIDDDAIPGRQAARRRARRPRRCRRPRGRGSAAARRAGCAARAHRCCSCRALRRCGSRCRRARPPSIRTTTSAGPGSARATSRTSIRAMS